MLKIDIQKKTQIFYVISEHVWKFYRKHYKDGFSINALNAFVPIFNEVVKKLQNKLDERVGTTEFDIFEHLYAFNAETILRKCTNILFGFTD